MDGGSELVLLCEDPWFLEYQKTRPDYKELAVIHSILFILFTLLVYLGTSSLIIWIIKDFEDTVNSIIMKTKQKILISFSFQVRKIRRDAETFEYLIMRLEIGTPIPVAA